MLALLILPTRCVEKAKLSLPLTAGRKRGSRTELWWYLGYALEGRGPGRCILLRTNQPEVWFEVGQYRIMTAQRGSQRIVESKRLTLSNVQLVGVSGSGCTDHPDRVPGPWAPGKTESC